MLDVFKDFIFCAHEIFQLSFEPVGIEKTYLSQILLVDQVKNLMNLQNKSFRGQSSFMYRGSSYSNDLGQRKNTILFENLED